MPGLEDVLKGNGTADGIGRDEGNRCTEKQREEARTRKNTNRSLQRLKEQIKAEKQRKRLEVCQIINHRNDSMIRLEVQVYDSRGAWARCMDIGAGSVDLTSPLLSNVCPCMISVHPSKTEH